MEVLLLRSSSSSATRRALRSLRQGEVFIFPTDTVYGIGGDALKPSVVRRVHRLKGRAKTKPFPWLVSDMVMANRFGTFSKKDEWFAKKVWPGATTLIVRRKQESLRQTRSTSSGQGTVALRIPDHAWLRKLIRSFGHPLIGTSANRSGRKPARTAREAKAIFPRVDLIVDGGPCKKRPSLIIDCTHKEARVLRN